MNYLVLGAGPAGLTIANRLLQLGNNNILVLEKEKEAGGLCRSALVDGFDLDIGGGHFLDVKRKNVNKFLFEFMPESEWNLFERDSKISIQNMFINHPFEANIWQMDEESQKKYLHSIAEAGCNTGESQPEFFIDWIYWKLGKCIAEDYMIPYNTKMFGTNLNQLGTYWLEKLPNVSYDDTLKSCKERKAYGIQPGHAKFYYPKKYGYGELWKRMADNLGNKIIYDSSVVSIDFDEKSVEIKTGENYKADVIIVTIPWLEFVTIKGMPQELIYDIHKLQYSSIKIDYYPKNLESVAHWIYYPEMELDYHRILLRHNFCSGSKGYWTETNTDRAKFNSKSLFSYINKYAYPLNTVNKREIMEKLLVWARSKSVYGLGRWGEHEHYNSDVTVERAIMLAEELCNIRSF